VLRLRRMTNKSWLGAAFVSWRMIGQPAIADIQPVYDCQFERSAALDHTPAHVGLYGLVPRNSQTGPSIVADRKSASPIWAESHGLDTVFTCACEAFVPRAQAGSQRGPWCLRRGALAQSEKDNFGDGLPYLGV
jgi:hypothetical protein